MLAPVVVLMTGRAVADPPLSKLEAQISGLHSAKGQIGCVLFASERGFPGDATAAFQSRWCPIPESKAVSCVFDDVPAGSYAVACFHDENNNRRCDQGFLGIPTEGYGVSNDAKSFMAPPKFRDAMFPYSGRPSRVPIHIGY
jgi:uncharacterized protein (DUF2141 family)